MTLVSPSWLRWLGLRIAGACVTLFAVVTFNFFLFRVLGDPANQLAQLPGTTPAAVARYRASLGLDKPLFPGQYLNYLDHLAHFDLGTSFTTHQAVTTMILSALPWTLLLAGAGLILAGLAGVFMGIAAASHRGTWRDHSLLGTALGTYSTPAYWSGVILVLLFSSLIPLFPGGQQMTPGATFSGFPAQAANVAHHLVLPAVTFALSLLGEFFLITRSSMIQVLGEDFVLVKRATGLPWRRIVYRHAFRNAMLPTVTLGALAVGFVVSSTVIVETVFSWPGLGEMTYQAIGNEDFPVLEGTFLVFAVIMLVANLFADVLYSILDPRVKSP